MGEYLVKGTYYDEEVDKSIPTEEIVIADGFHIESGQVLVFTRYNSIIGTHNTAARRRWDDVDLVEDA